MFNIDIIGLVTNLLITLLLLPLQIILAPLDMLLAKIPGIGAVAGGIGNIVGLIGSIPETIVYLFGFNTFLWNTLFLVFVLFFTLAPAINIIKKVWAWVRP